MTTTSHAHRLFKGTHRSHRALRWNARRALELDLSWAHQHLASLRDSIGAAALPGIRTHAAALRSILVQHMAWETELSDEHGGVLARSGWDALALSLRRWHGTIHRALFSIGMLVASPSLEFASVRDMLRRSVDGLEALLECYAEEIGGSVYRAMDRGLVAMGDARAAALTRQWRACMSAGYAG